MLYVADFETVNKKDDCRVWAYGYMEVGTSELHYGNNITDFLHEVEEQSIHENIKIWFHNLKFDGEFIVDWLFRNGYEYTTERLPKERQFTTLIGDMGQWYGITIKPAQNTHLIQIYDSLKLIPFSVDEIAKSFHLPIRKLEIDYNEEREIGHELTPKEIRYLNNDIEIMSMALSRLFDLGLKKITAGSNALSSYKNLVDASIFERWFPSLSEDEDTFVRKSYRGGWTYASKRIIGKDVGRGIVLDVNSLYPSRMKSCRMPYGKGVFFVGKYKSDKTHPLYIQKIECAFKIRKGYLPTIQLKNNPGFLKTEYIEDSHDEIVEITLTNVDLELFLEHYDTSHLSYIEGYKYRAASGMFDDYIEYWLGVKVTAEKDGDFALRAIAKLMLNSLYGKFAKRPKTRSKYPIFETGKVQYRLGDMEDVGNLYIPVGTFITSYARDYTIRSAQKNYDRFLYADTDSLHLEGEEYPSEINIDKYELGAWKHEGTFARAKYLRAKCYLEDMEYELDKIIEKLDDDPDMINRTDLIAKTISEITCSGMPAKLHNFVTYEKFHIGMKLEGKLRFVHVPGGIVLEETTFEIKP